MASNSVIWTVKEFQSLEDDKYTEYWTHNEFLRKHREGNITNTT